MNKKTQILFLCFCLFVISGCQENTAITQQAPAINPNVTTKIYSCEACPVVRLDTYMPTQVQTGAEFGYRFIVTNLTDEVLTNVVVTDVSTDNFMHIQSTPPPFMDQNKVKWILNELGPKETKEISGTAKSLSGGIAFNYVDVAYTAPIRLQTISLEPKIVLTKSAPAEISACAPILYIFKVENTGTGAANNLRIYDTLPQGLMTTQCNSNIDICVGTLPAGESRVFTVPVKASRPGTYTNCAIAVADGDITADSGMVTTVVTKPALSITNTGPETDYINMELTYNISVTNTGDWPAFNTVIENCVPAGLRFIRANQAGNLTCNNVIWKIARINPGDTVNTSVTYMANTLGTIESTAKASAECADAVTATARTIIKGAPGMLLEVCDTKDPVKLGDTAIYAIVVTNQGSVPITNISIKAMLEPSMNYVGNIGATKGLFAENGTITFEPLTYLAPQAQAIWKVTIRAANESDARFKVEMTADQLDRNVTETESTHFFK